MRVVARGALDLRSITGVVETDLVLVGVTVAVAVEEADPGDAAGSRIEIHARLAGKAYANRMIVAEIGSDDE